MSHIHTNIPREICDIISAVPIARYTLVEDRIIWCLTHSRDYSTRSAYFFLQSGFHVLNDQDSWSWIWKLQIPQKYKTFVWLCMWQRLLTNEARARIGMEVCQRCESCCENMIYVLRDCYKAKEVWFRVLPQGRRSSFFEKSRISVTVLFSM